MIISAYPLFIHIFHEVSVKQGKVDIKSGYILKQRTLSIINEHSSETIRP
jgi:hypothetical protein